MSVACIFVALTLIGVNFGWQPAEDGSEGYDYLVQLEPETVRLLHAGEPVSIDSNIPDDVQPVRRIKIVVGREELPHRRLTSARETKRDDAVEQTAHYRGAEEQPLQPASGQIQQVGPANGSGYYNTQTQPQSAAEAFMQPAQRLGQGLEQGFKQGTELVDQAGQRLREGIDNVTQGTRQSINNVVSGNLPRTLPAENFQPTVPPTEFRTAASPSIPATSPPSTSMNALGWPNPNTANNGTAPSTVSNPHNSGTASSAPNTLNNGAGSNAALPSTSRSAFPSSGGMVPVSSGSTANSGTPNTQQQRPIEWDVPNSNSNTANNGSGNGSGVGSGFGNGFGNSGGSSFPSSFPSQQPQQQQPASQPGPGGFANTPSSISPTSLNVPTTGPNVFDQQQQQTAAQSTANQTAGTGEGSNYMLLLFLLIASLGFNAYVGASYLDARNKYRAALRRTSRAFGGRTVAA